MKRIVIAALAFSVVTSVPSRAFGEDVKASPPAAPKPAAELAQLKWFEGSWSCGGKVFESPMGPEHATQGKVTMQLDLGGFWYSVRYEEMKTKENPRPYRVGAFWGYDSAQKRFVAGSVDSMGGFSGQAAPGWDGDKLVFTGFALGMGPNKTPARDTFTKKGENEMMHASELTMAEGQWLKLDEETCRRSAAAKSTTSTKTATSTTKTKTAKKSEPVKK
jgi:hypothetical protein